MNELSAKIAAVLANSKGTHSETHDLHDPNLNKLVEFLWAYTCVRDRVTNKTELREELIYMRDQSQPTSNPENKLMGKPVTVGDLNKDGVVRGYDPASGKWWVVITESAWYTEEELTVK